jgi:hypothetical protein
VKQKRFSVEQIVAVLKQAEVGVPLVELIRRVGISEQTFYRWKKQYVGLEVVRSTSSSDAYGNLQVMQREVADTRKTSPNTQETKTTVYLLDGNGRLTPFAQTQELQKRGAVDIDPQAVEVTKLSLLLKVLEGETDESFALSQLAFGERALPNLADNIKCGNSLIGSDYFTGKMFSDAEEMKRVNAFDWKQGFPDAMRDGGFDCIIGNPPYVRQESLSQFKDYFETHYESFDGVADLYVYFMESGVRLLREGGYYSIIVSSSFMRTTFAAPLREFLKKAAAILRIVDFGGLAVFENAKDTYVCIPLLSKRPHPKRVEIAKVASLDLAELDAYVAPRIYTISNERLTSEAWSLKSDAEANLFEKIMKAGQPLGEFVERRFFRGVTSGLNDAFVIDSKARKALIAKDKRSAQIIKPLLSGENIRRWLFHRTDAWLIFTKRGVDIDAYPAIREHLSQWRDELTPKKSSSDRIGRKPGKYKWYEIQDDVAYFQTFESPKIIFPDIAKGPRFSLDTDGNYLTNTAYCLGSTDSYLLGILNSRLFWFAISNISIPFGVRAGEYRYRLIYQYMEKVPIRAIDFSDISDKARHEKMLALVGSMTGLQKQLAAAKSAAQKAIVQRQIDATDRQIDQLVYQLYGLTDEEVALIEEELTPTIVQPA